jgi:uncharacterized phage-associated protein
MNLVKNSTGAKSRVIYYAFGRSLTFQTQPLLRFTIETIGFMLTTAI